ncbi:MAG: MmcQ/YjbR family DNA-binding protein [Chitinophagaceae bacterium]|nr:MmcQ/YjbR family DNA-binding protein [Chitinophagaceae bacterium]
MVAISTFKKIALSFPEVTETPHFEKSSFRVNKKIFATLDLPNKRACLKFKEIDQSVFCSYHKEIIYPVPNRWGKLGWTFVELAKVPKSLFMDALATSYCSVATTKLAEQVRPRETNRST